MTPGSLHSAACALPLPKDPITPGFRLALTVFLVTLKLLRSRKTARENAPPGFKSAATPCGRILSSSRVTFAFDLSSALIAFFK